MLRTRIYTVLVLLPLFVAGLFYAPPAAWALLLAPLVLVGAWEWGGLAGWRTAQRLAYAFAMGAGGVALWRWGYGDTQSAHVLRIAVLGASAVFWFVIAPVWLARGWRLQAPVALGVAGAVLLLPLWLALIQLHAQPVVLLLLMAIVWVSDTAAYFCGKRWGQRKLAVAISPGKTWEGVYGALAAVTAYFVLVNALNVAGHTILRGTTGCVVFLLLAVLGIEGDLFESWIKRTAGVKDSGTAFPGHGGVLDRIDALTASTPMAALLLGGAL